MNREQIKYLADKFQDGTLTAAENLEWQQILRDPKMEKELLALIETSWKNIPDNELSDMEESRSKAILEDIVVQPQITAPVRRLWPRIGIAAAVAVMIAGAGLFFYNAQQKNAVPTAMVINDVAPGKQGATLTLANGKEIKLTNAANGQLAKEDGVVITKSASGQLIYTLRGDTSGVSAETMGANAHRVRNSLRTAKGETYVVVLPDGSKVWLNSASSLIYSTNINISAQRVVTLEGEGYFEIAKDKQRPFVVITRNQEVEVLGTHFNINAYQDEPVVTTTLLEGSVKVADQKRQQMLKPGEQALNSGTAIKVAQANMESVMDWKEGDFYFERVDFRALMRKIGRWYDVEVVCEPSVPLHITASGVIPRDNQLSAVLKSIEASGQVHFKLEGKKLIVTK